jgi:hypothetical protein
MSFDMIVDTDISIINLIKNKYNDPSVFDNNILNYDDHILKGLIQLNTSRNPINLILINTNNEQAENFYNELIDDEYETIVKTSPATTLLDMVKRFIDSGGPIVSTILCRTEIEKQHVKEIFGEYSFSELLKFVVEPDWSNVDLSKYDTILIKYIEDLLEFNNVIGKNIMISKYLYNLDESLYKERITSIKLDIASAFVTNNEFYIITQYYYDDSYYIEKQNNDTKEI